MRDQAEQLRRAARQTGSLPGASASPGQSPLLIAVVSGKGGVGKSSFALTLAHRLGRQGLSTLVVDANLHSPSLHVLANASSPLSISRLMKQGVFDPQQLFVSIGPKVDLLSNDEPISQLGRSHPESSSFLLELLFDRNTGHSVVIFDTETGLDHWNLELISACRTHFLLTFPEPTAIIDSYTYLKNVRPYLSPATFQLVFSQVLSEENAEEAFRKFNLALAHFLNFQFSGYFSTPFEATVKQAINEQNPFWKSEKCYHFVHSVDKIVAHLIETLPIAHKEILTLKDEV